MRQLLRLLDQRAFSVAEYEVGKQGAYLRPGARVGVVYSVASHPSAADSQSVILKPGYPNIPPMLQRIVQVTRAEQRCLSSLVDKNFAASSRTAIWQAKLPPGTPFGRKGYVSM